MRLRGADDVDDDVDFELSYRVLRTPSECCVDLLINVDTRQVGSDLFSKRET